MQGLKIIHLAKMGSLSLMDRSIEHLLCVIDVFMKYAWFIL